MALKKQTMHWTYWIAEDYLQIYSGVAWDFEGVALVFLHTLTSVYRQNWSWEEIPSSQNSDKAASLICSVVVNIASSV